MPYQQHHFRQRSPWEPQVFTAEGVKSEHVETAMIQVLDSMEKECSLMRTGK